MPNEFAGIRKVSDESLGGDETPRHTSHEIIIIITIIIMVEMVEVVPVVIGALGSVTKGFNRWIGKLGIPFNVGVMQKNCLVGNCKDIEESVGNVKKR